MKNGVTATRLDDVIESALTNKHSNQQRFGRGVECYSRQISQARPAGLPDDLDADVADEEMVQLLKAGVATLAADTGKAVLRKAVRKTVRIVRANFVPPGQRTRPVAGERTRVLAAEQMRVAASAKPTAITAEHVSRMVDAKAIERAAFGEGVNRAIEFDRLEHSDADVAIEYIEDRMKTDFILGQARSVAAHSLRLIYLDGEPVTFAASAAHLRRFALKRRVKAALSYWRVAA